MKINLYFILFTTLYFIGCKQEDHSVDRIVDEAVLVYDGIETKMPGVILATESYIAWSDPFSIENQIHIVDIQHKEEVYKGVSLGDGPEEFILPTFTVSSDKEKLIIWDCVKNKIECLAFDNLKKDTSFYANNKLNLENASQLLDIDGDVLLFTPEDSIPFKTNNQNFGKSFFTSEINNKNSIAQGLMLYNNINNKMIFSTFYFPYIAIYERQNKEFKLLKEIIGEKDYDIIDNKIHLNKSKKGILEMALTKDYIVTIQRDYDNDMTDESSVGHDFHKLPQTLFVYDYDGNLKSIIDLQMPLLRLASCSQNNTVYIIGVLSDFQLFKYDLL